MLYNCLALDDGDGDKPVVHNIHMKFIVVPVVVSKNALKICITIYMHFTHNNLRIHKLGSNIHTYTYFQQKRYTLELFIYYTAYIAIYYLCTCVHMYVQYRLPNIVVSASFFLVKVMT